MNAVGRIQEARGVHREVKSEKGLEIMIDNCQDILFGGFAPNSESAEILSKVLGNRTVLYCLVPSVRERFIEREGRHRVNGGCTSNQYRLIRIFSASSSCVKLSEHV